jgi:hypothetical protein
MNPYQLHRRFHFKYRTFQHFSNQKIKAECAREHDIRHRIGDINIIYGIFMIKKSFSNSITEMQNTEGQ